MLGGVFGEFRGSVVGGVMGNWGRTCRGCGECVWYNALGDGVESQSTVGVAVLDPAESSLVDVGCVGRASVTVGNNAAVYTLNLDEQLRDFNFDAYLQCCCSATSQAAHSEDVHRY